MTAARTEARGPGTEKPLAAAGVLALACLLSAGCAQSPRTAALSAGYGGATLRLSPAPAFSGTRLLATLGEDGPDPATLRFEWRRNGQQLEGVTGPELEPSNFSKGDRIAVWVTVPAAAGGHARELSAETRIENSAPRITNLGIALENDPAGPQLRARAESVDPDGDTPRLECRWSVNGEPVRGANGTSLPAARLARGDRVELSAVAHDEDAASLEATATFTLENHPPAFTSQPLAPKAADATFEYRASASDPDGDPLVYSLVQGPAGMTVSPQGDVRWELPTGADRRGEHSVRLRATDPGGGEAVQEFTIRL